MNVRAVAAGVLATAWLSGPAAAGDMEPRLSDLVVYIPDAAAYYLSAPILTYVDFRAVERVTGAPAPRSQAEYAGSEEVQELWRNATIMRMAFLPRWMSFLLPMLESGPGGLAEAVGLDFFVIDRSLTFGLGPLPVTMLLGDGPFPERDRVEGALEARGFAAEMVGEVPVWHRFEDGEISIADRNVSDPFGGHVGAASRIALLPGALIGAPTWATMRSVLEAPMAQRSGNVMRTALEAAVEAVEAFGGESATLVQAQALPSFATYITGAMLDRTQAALNGASLDEDPVASATVLEAQIAADKGALPKYLLALLADLQIGEEHVDIIALPYPDAATAARAAEIVSGRLQGWALPRRKADGPALAEFGGSLQSLVIAVGDVAVALVAARYPAAKVSRRPVILGGLLPMWMVAIDQAEFGPLAASE